MNTTPIRADSKLRAGASVADVGCGVGDALDRAKTDGWTVVSVKDDWRTVFADP